jgi:hypothetical protein
MPPLSDPERLQCYRNALANWRFEGRVRFRELADRWVRKELGGCTTRDVARPRAMDNLLRAYFALPQLRAALRGKEQDPASGTEVMAQQN